MRGMLPPSEARMADVASCRSANAGRWTYRDWIRWRFLWKFFPWYARANCVIAEISASERAACTGFWEDPDKKERGYCSGRGFADNRT